jgi:energy-coupling factor transport system permease protein
VARQDAFSGYHPVVNFAYFALVLLFSMCLLHPVSLLISLVCALCYRAQLEGGKAAGRALGVLLPLALLAAFLNPAFNHEGATILTYLPTGNPLTLESIAYGWAAAGMLAAVILWFGCYNLVMTTDKLVYLFGRVIPALSLVLSMTLRFVPRFKAQLDSVVEAQRCVGRDVTKGSLLQRTRRSAAVLSILVSWALENAVETADSMKSRGYGLPGRTAFSIYRFQRRDKAVLAWLCLCVFLLLYAVKQGGFTWRYFPTMSGNLTGGSCVGGQLVYLALCLTPVMLDRREARTWRRLRSAL